MAPFVTALATRPRHGYFIEADSRVDLVDRLIVGMARQIRSGQIDPNARRRNLDTLRTELTRLDRVA